MASGSFNLSDNQAYQWAWVYYEESNVNISTNTSTITVWVYFRRTNNGYTSSGTMNTTVTVDSATQTESISFSNNGTTDTLLFARAFNNISHNPDGSKSVFISVTATGNQGFSGSGSTTVSLDTIPRQATLTAAPDFNDEGNPTISYSNPAGNAVTALDACISFTGATANIAYRAVSKTGSSYTFNLTAAERIKLRQWVTAGSSSREVTFFLRTNIGGTIYYSTIKKTVTIINDTPTLSSTVEITDDLTKELTGNSNTIIKNVSTVNYAINAAAYKEAAINGQWVLNNGVYKYENTGTFTNLQSGYFLFAASDNRGRHIRKEITKSFVDYVKLTCNAEVNIALVSEALANITIKIYGNYFNNTFGAITNDIALAYRYKTESGNYGEWVNLTTSLTPTFSGNTYELTVTIENLDYKNAYTIQCAASDKVTYIESAETTIKAVPVFDWGKEDFNFNVPISIQNQPVEDFLIERDTSGIWTYEKWASGKAVCYGKKNYGTMATHAWGYLFETDGMNIDFPSGLFIENPQVMHIDFLYGGGIGGFIERGAVVPTKDSIGEFCVARASQLTYSNLTIGFYIVGKWK